MKILKQIDPKTRVIESYSLFFGWMIKYQVKKWYGWNTISYLYSGQYPNLQGYLDYFKWDIRFRIGETAQFK